MVMELREKKLEISATVLVLLILLAVVYLYIQQTQAVSANYIKGVYYSDFDYDGQNYTTGIVLNEEDIIDIEILLSDTGDLILDEGVLKLIQKIIELQSVDFLHEDKLSELEIAAMNSVIQMLNEATVQEIYVVETPYETLFLNAALDDIYQIEVDGYQLKIQVLEGKISVLEAQCPEHECIKTGEIGQETFYPIVCLPNKVTISSYKNYITWN